jgi:AP endonuclease-1
LPSANAFALFLKSQRKWENPELDPEVAKLFIEGCEKHGIDPAGCCVPHGSYLVNLAHPDLERKKQAYDSFINDLARCHTLGIKLYNFHPGNANATTREEGIRLIAENINQAHRDPATGEVVAILETMATQGNTIGGTFSDIAEIIALVVDKERVGVCLDTCHVFAAGYDLRTPEAYMATMEDFDKVIGLKYLKALHINDSKAPLFSHRDLHARIGTGYLGLRAFHNIVNDTRLHGLPMVLETPIDIIGEDGKKSEDKNIWAREIKMLESLVGMDIESKEFQDLEDQLQEEGKDEREKIGDQVERKKIKDAKPKRASKKKTVSEGEDQPEPEKKSRKKTVKAPIEDMSEEESTEKASKKKGKGKDAVSVRTKMTTVKQGATDTEDVLDVRPKRTRGKKVATYADEEIDE